MHTETPPKKHRCVTRTSRPAERHQDLPDGRHLRGVGEVGMGDAAGAHLVAMFWEDDHRWVS